MAINPRTTAVRRRALRRLGVRLGPETVFLPVLVKPKAARLRALWWSIHNDLPPRPPPQ